MTINSITTDINKKGYKLTLICPYICSKNQSTSSTSDKFIETSLPMIFRTMNSDLRHQRLLSIQNPTN